MPNLNGQCAMKKILVHAFTVFLMARSFCLGYQNSKQQTKKQKSTSFLMTILSGLLITADVISCKTSIDYTFALPAFLTKQYGYLSD